jgi:hypothetical protein
MDPTYTPELSPATIAVIAAFSLALCIFYIITTWRIFQKAGQPGWAALVPIYNVVVMFRVAGMSAWWTLSLLAAIIPLIGSLFQLGVMIYALHRIAQNFGRGPGFTVGLILLSFIFMPILAFGSSRYRSAAAS